MQINIIEAATQYLASIGATGTPDSDGVDGTVSKPWHVFINNIINNDTTVIGAIFPNNLNLPIVSSIFFPFISGGYDIRGSIIINRPIELIGEVNTILYFRVELSYQQIPESNILSQYAAMIIDFDSNQNQGTVLIKQLSLKHNGGWSYLGATIVHAIYNKEQLVIERCHIDDFSGTCLYNTADNWQISWSFFGSCGMDGFYTTGSRGTAIYLHTSYCGRFNIPDNTTPKYYGINDVSTNGNTFICAHSATNAETGSFYAQHQGVWMGCYTENEDPQPVINEGALWINQHRQAVTGSGTISRGNIITMNEGHQGIKFLNDIEPENAVFFTAGSHLPHVIFEFGALQDVSYEDFAPRIGNLDSEMQFSRQLSHNTLAKMAIQYPSIYSYLKLVKQQVVLSEERNATSDVSIQKTIDEQITAIEKQKGIMASEEIFLDELKNIKQVLAIFTKIADGRQYISELVNQKEHVRIKELLQVIEEAIVKVLLVIKEYYAQIKDLIGIEPPDWTFNSYGLWRLRFDYDETSVTSNTWYKLQYETNEVKIVPAILFSSRRTPLNEADQGSVAFPRGFYLGNRKTKISNAGLCPTSGGKKGDIVFNTNPTEGSAIGGWICISPNTWKEFTLE